VAAGLPAALVGLLQTADFDVRREERLQLFSPLLGPEPRRPQGAREV